MCGAGNADSDQEPVCVRAHPCIHTQTHTQFQPTQSLIKRTTNPDLQRQAVSGEAAHAAEIIDARPHSHDSASLACLQSTRCVFQMLLPFSRALLAGLSPFHRAKPHTQRPRPLRIGGLFLTRVQAAPPSRLQSQCFPLGAPQGRL